jgi:hypothetical protein
MMAGYLLCFTCEQKSGNQQSSGGVQQIEIKEELEWREIEDFINSISRNKLTLDQGKDSIISFLQKRYPSFDSRTVSKVNFHNLRHEFLDWVRVPLQHSPPDDNIRSLYFGMFESTDPQLVDDGKSVMVFYVAGSDRTPAEDVHDWAVNPRYLPDARYIIFDDYIFLYNELKRYDNHDQVEQIIINGISNLIISNSLLELKHLTGKERLSVGSGFDEGPAFMVGE